MTHEDELHLAQIDLRIRRGTMSWDDVKVMRRLLSEAHEALNTAGRLIVELGHQIPDGRNEKGIIEGAEPSSPADTLSDIHPCPSGAP